MPNSTAAEPLRSALRHFDFALTVARSGSFDRDDREGRRDRYALEGALYLGAAAVASASGWLLRHPPEVRQLAYSVVDLGPLQVGEVELPGVPDLWLRLQAGRIIAGLIEGEGVSTTKFDEISDI